MKWSRKFELSPVFVASMIHRETNFNEKAVSKSNARGPMQAIAKWHPEKLKKLGIKEKDLHSINHGVHVGCWIIKEYLERCNWNYREALKKYVGAVNNSADGYIDDIFKMTMYAYEE
jgi:soluble lytic murein transglycosylase